MGRRWWRSAVPISDQDAAFFEVTTLGDIEDALASIRLALAASVVASSLAAGLLGYWASRYTIRPLTRVSHAAQSVALGQLDTRLDYNEYRHDPDLAPLVANFNGMLQALQARITRDARFASDVSHELRSPLTTLNAGLQVLDNNREDMPERARQALDLLADDVVRFTQLVEDLLEISRFDAGAVRLELDDVALVPMISSTVAHLTNGEVPVEAEPDVEQLVLACDKRRLARILANFLNNADKYADGATHVSITRHDPDPEEPLAESTIRIGVEDAGPGVPADQRDVVFDRFNRGDQGGARGADVGVGTRSRTRRRARQAAGRPGLGRGADRRRTGRTVRGGAPAAGGTRGRRRGRPLRRHSGIDEQPDPHRGTSGRRHRRTTPGPVMTRRTARSAGGRTASRPGTHPLQWHLRGSGRLLLGAVTASALVVGCGIGDDSAPRALPISTTTSTTEAPETGGQAVAIAYFVQDEKLVPLIRQVSTMDPASTMQALLAPPTQEEGSGLSSAIPAGTELIDLTLVDGTLTVDMSVDFEGVVGPIRTLALGQIVMSETTLPNVDRVAFTIDGEPLQVNSPRGDVSTVNACDYETLLADPEADTTVLQPEELNILALVRENLADTC